MTEDYPLQVVDDRGRHYTGAVREWALDLIKDDADHIVSIHGKAARVVDTRNWEVCYRTDKGITKYGRSLNV